MLSERQKAEALGQGICPIAGTRDVDELDDVFAHELPCGSDQDIPLFQPRCCVFVNVIYCRFAV